MNNTVINYENDFPKKVLSWLITLTILFVPSSVFAWLGIKDDLVLQILLTIGPSIIELFYFSMKLLIRKLTIEIHITKTFAKYNSFIGNGYFFIELNEQLKKKSDEEKKSVIIKQSLFSTNLKVKYHIFSNSLEIITVNKTNGENSSTSKDNFAFLEFDKKNKKNFNIYYGFLNSPSQNASRNLTSVQNLNSFQGYAKIEVMNYEIRNFIYVSDIVNRFSYGFYNPENKGENTNE